MSDEPIDHIGYDSISREALRALPREALARVAKMECLPGAHHFIIAFATSNAQVEMASSLRARYPEEITIIIQHQYSDLEVGDDAFELVLKFDGQPERLRIPYAAITHFADPSVGFALAFDSPDQEITPPDDEDTPVESADIVDLDAFRQSK